MRCEGPRTASHFIDAHGLRELAICCHQDPVAEDHQSYTYQSLTTGSASSHDTCLRLQMSVVAAAAGVLPYSAVPKFSQQGPTLCLMIQLKIIHVRILEAGYLGCI